MKLTQRQEAQASAAFSKFVGKLAGIILAIYSFYAFGTKQLDSETFMVLVIIAVVLIVANKNKKTK